MTTLTITTRGQVTFRRDLLQHLGSGLGTRFRWKRCRTAGLLKAARPEGTIDEFVGLLKGKSRKKATIDEINEAAAAGWAGRK